MAGEQHPQPNFQCYRSQRQGVRADFRAYDIVIGVEEVQAETTFFPRVVGDVAKPVPVTGSQNVTIVGWWYAFDSSDRVSVLVDIIQSWDV